MTLILDRAEPIVALPAEDAPPERVRRRLAEPGRATMRDVPRYWYVMTLLIRKEVRLRYRYSSLGYLWAYVRPAMQFCVYYFVIGILLDITKKVDNFAVFVFSGLCIVTVYNTTVNSATKSVVKNKSIIKKVDIPRELFPVSALVVSMTRLVPLMTILLIGATVTGWELTWVSVAAALLGFLIVVLLSFGIGLLFSALYVFLRELQHILEITGFMTHWLVPMVHPWFIAQERLERFPGGDIIMIVYLWNPLCTSVELFHKAFWLSTVDNGSLSPHLWTRGAFSVGFCLVLIAFAQFVFARLRELMAEEL